VSLFGTNVEFVETEHTVMSDKAMAFEFARGCVGTSRLEEWKGIVTRVFPDGSRWKGRWSMDCNYPDMAWIHVLVKLPEPYYKTEILAMLRRADEDIDEVSVMFPLPGVRESDFLLDRYPDDKWTEGVGSLDACYEEIRVNRAGTYGNLGRDDL
jgi:hypothetical protein